MNEKKLAAAFDEWLRLYVEEPERFKREWQVVLEYVGDRGARLSPRYGRACAAFLLSLLEK